MRFSPRLAVFVLSFITAGYLHADTISIAFINFSNKNSSMKFDSLRKTIPKIMSIETAKIKEAYVLDNALVEKAMRSINMTDVDIDDKENARKIGVKSNARACVVGRISGDEKYVRVEARLYIIAKDEFWGWTDIGFNPNDNQEMQKTILSLALKMKDIVAGRIRDIPEIPSALKADETLTGEKLASVAPLIFKNVSKEKGLKHLERTIQMEIASSLSKTGKVLIPETAKIEEVTKKYKIEEIESMSGEVYKSIGREVGADIILRGYIRRVEKGFRFDVFLINSNTGRTMYILKGRGVIRGKSGAEIEQNMELLKHDVNELFSGPLDELYKYEEELSMTKVVVGVIRFSNLTGEAKMNYLQSVIPPAMNLRLSEESARMTMLDVAGLDKVIGNLNLGLTAVFSDWDLMKIADAVGANSLITGNYNYNSQKELIITAKAIQGISGKSVAEAGIALKKNFSEDDLKVALQALSERMIEEIIANRVELLKTPFFARQSPVNSALLSLAVPGWGQLCNQNAVKAGGFFGVWVAGVGSSAYLVIKDNALYQEYLDEQITDNIEPKFRTANQFHQITTGVIAATLALWLSASVESYIDSLLYQQTRELAQYKEEYAYDSHELERDSNVSGISISLFRERF